MYIYYILSESSEKNELLVYSLRIFPIILYSIFKAFGSSRLTIIYSFYLSEVSE